MGEVKLTGEHQKGGFVLCRSAKWIKRLDPMMGSDNVSARALFGFSCDLSIEENCTAGEDCLEGKDITLYLI